MVLWEIRDVKGVKLAEREKPVALNAAGAVAEVTLPLVMPHPGWYGLHITLNDEAGNTLFRHEAAFALLGQNTRTAGYESPFGTWWSIGEHGTTRDTAVPGSLMLQAGIRRPTASRGDSTFTETDLAPWNLTLNKIPWEFRRGDLKDWPAAEARVGKKIAELLRRFPHCQYVRLRSNEKACSVRKASRCSDTRKLNDKNAICRSKRSGTVRHGCGRGC